MAAIPWDPHDIDTIADNIGGRLAPVGILDIGSNMAWGWPRCDMLHHARRAEIYRNKAKEMSRIAGRMHTPEAKRIFISIAADYLEMAQMMERMAATHSESDSKL